VSTGSGGSRSWRVKLLAAVPPLGRTAGQGADFLQKTPVASTGTISSVMSCSDR
jgi:hypothetical protein